MPRFVGSNHWLFSLFLLNAALTLATSHAVSEGRMRMFIHLFHKLVGDCKFYTSFALQFSEKQCRSLNSSETRICKHLSLIYPVPLSVVVNSISATC